MTTTPDTTGTLRPVEHTAAAAEAVRALNHATLNPDTRSGGYVWPSDVDVVIGALEQLAQRLPQALTQAGCWLEREQTAGRVGHDGPGTDVAATVGWLLGDLEAAVREAADLAATLTFARAASTHLTGTAPVQAGEQ